MILEVCANSLTSALNAHEAGVHRIELCENLEAGGITPRSDLIKTVKEKISIPVHVLIRPRVGDFVYSDADFDVICSEVILCKKLGADGLVAGILKEDHTVDVDRCHQLMELAHPLGLTFHRAFDVIKDPSRALEELIELGFERVLTSGQKPDCQQGAATISHLVKQAAGRITIMPGGGITEFNIAEVVKQTGAVEFHFSARKTMTGGGMVSDLNTIRRIKQVAEKVLDEELPS